MACTTNIAIEENAIMHALRPLAFAAKVSETIDSLGKGCAACAQ
jgi:hypothetical protein